MTDRIRWMKVIDDRIWMKRDILDAASMQRRGRQRKEAGALLAKNHFFTALFPLSQVASKFVGRLEISYLRRSVKIHGPPLWHLVLNYYLPNAVVNSCT